MVKKKNNICQTIFSARYPVVINNPKEAITSCTSYFFRIHEAKISTQKTRLETRRPSNSKKIGPCKCVRVSAMMPWLLLSSLSSSESVSSEAVPWTSFFRFAFRRCLAVLSWRASFRMSSVHFSIRPACGTKCSY